MKHVAQKTWVAFMAPRIHKFDNNITVDDAVNIADTLYQLYSHPCRKYHGVYHPMFMLEFAKENKIELTKEQELAIIFHDAIYKIGYVGNEDASGELFNCLIQPFRDDTKKFWDKLRETRNIIEDTSQHFQTKPQFKSELSPLVLDIDLCSLTLDHKEAKKWDDLVGAEMPDVPAEKRIAFYEMMLNKEKIMMSKEMAHFEERVRENFKKFIEEKKNGS